jgi:hypothetical protein
MLGLASIALASSASVRVESSEAKTLLLISWEMMGEAFSKERMA